MDSIVLVTFESAEHSMNHGLIKPLLDRQRRCRNSYAIHRVQIVIGEKTDVPRTESEQPQGVSNEKIIRWTIARSGGEENTKRVRECIPILGTLVQSRMRGGIQKACHLVSIGENSGSAAFFALLLTNEIQHELASYLSISTQIILLQNQMLFNDVETAYLMRLLRSYNKGVVNMNNVYLLPWDENDPKLTINTVDAIVTGLTLRNNFALVNGTPPRDENFVTTAAVTSLKSPNERIKSLIYARLYHSLMEKGFNTTNTGVVADAVNADDIRTFTVSARKLLDEIRRQCKIPNITELYALMPKSNPQGISRKQAEDVPNPVNAWKQLENIYGADGVAYLRKMLKVEVGEREVIFAEGRHKLAGMIIRAVAEAGSKKAIRLGAIYEWIEGLEDSLINPKQYKKSGEKGDRERRGSFSAAGQIEPVEFSCSLFPKPEIGIARARQQLLEVVYRESARQIGDGLQQYMKEMVSGAVQDAEFFLKNSIHYLEAKMREIWVQRHQLVGQVEDCYDEGLEEAYGNYWCTENIAGDEWPDIKYIYRVYENIGTEDFNSEYSSAETVREYSDKLAEQIEKRLENFTADLMTQLHVHIDGFFEEISYRKQLLDAHQHNVDLLGGMLDSLQSRLAQPPLLKRIDADLPAKQKLFIVQDSANASDVAKSVNAISNAAMLLDPFGRGVRLLVKYQGAALFSTSVYMHNDPDVVLRS